jgi:hypothetical protein
VERQVDDGRELLKMSMAYLKCAGFVIFAVIAVLIHWTSFELRYMWYPRSPEAAFLRTGYTICVGMIVLLWSFFPSRLLVLAVGVIAVLFPPVLRGDAFAAVDIRYMIAALPSILLLMAVTELRRRLPPLATN